MKVKIGDYISIYYDDANQKDLTFTGLVINILCDPKPFKRKKNISKWVTLIMLIEGGLQRISYYWDDEIKIHSSLINNKLN